MKIDRISEEVAKELGLSPIQVTQINRVQWKFLMETMQSEGFDSVKIMYVGKFHKNNKFNEDGTRRLKRDNTGNVE